MIVQEPSVFYAQSRILNALPPSVRDCKSLSSAALGRNPKTHCLQSAFTIPWRRSHKCDPILARSWRYINHLPAYQFNDTSNSRGHVTKYI